MSTYRVKEIFGPTLQGEGAHAGSACVFLRFAVCNLACTWCDTDFSPKGSAQMGADEITQRLIELDVNQSRMVVVTGGEPALQWDEPLAQAIAGAGFRAHMESNGTVSLKAPVDWLTVSPKPQFHLVNHALVLGEKIAADECKVVCDQTVTAEILARYEAHYDCEYWFVQPCDDPSDPTSLARAIDFVKTRPHWRLSLQTHKITGVP